MSTIGEPLLVCLSSWCPSLQHLPLILSRYPLVYQLYPASKPDSPILSSKVTQEFKVT